MRLHGADPDGVEAVVAARMRLEEAPYDTSKAFTFESITGEEARHLITTAAGELREGN